MVAAAAAAAAAAAGAGADGAADADAAAKLTPEEGHVFARVLDYARWLNDAHITGTHGVQSPKDVEKLHGAGPQAALQLQMMLAKAYTHWEAAPAGPGVLDLLRLFLSKNLEEMERLAKTPGAEGDERVAFSLAVLARMDRVVGPGGWAASWGRPGARVHGAFVIVEYLEEGALAVRDRGEQAGLRRYEETYVIAGIQNSIRALMSRMSPKLPACIRTTLLPFEGRWVYDGFIGPHKMPGIDKEKAQKAAAQAKAEGKVRAQPPAPPDDEAAAAEGGFDGPVEQRHQDVRAKLKKLRKKPAPAGVNVFRRVGYDEVVNPTAAVTVINGKAEVIGTFQYSTLEPGPDEVLARVAEFYIGAKFKPEVLQVDVLRCVAPLRKLLGPTGIQVAYYAPPSPEEEYLSEIVGGAF